MRPLPLAARSARRFTVSEPVMTMSPAVSPSPRPLSGSLLVTLRMRPVTALTASSAWPDTFTETIWWFGGQSTAGDALRLVMTGAVVSRTVTVKLPEAVLPAASWALAFTVVVPSGKVLPEAGLSVTTTAPSVSSVAEAV
jgi:hypothetical protein